MVRLPDVATVPDQALAALQLVAFVVDQVITAVPPSVIVGGFTAIFTVGSGLTVSVAESVAELMP